MHSKLQQDVRISQPKKTEFSKKNINQNENVPKKGTRALSGSHWLKEYGLTPGVELCRFAHIPLNCSKFIENGEVKCSQILRRIISKKCDFFS